ncbi:phage major capsid protein [Streptomyces profundus]|nr:phage major capsid protein [Streptomyces sp. MA3_2.13]
MPNNATPTSFTARPNAPLAPAQLKEPSEDNRPLLGSDPTTPTRRAIAGVPLFVSPAVTPGTVWGIPRDRVFVVLRRDVRVDISADGYFSSDQVAVRGTMRVGFGFPPPAAVTRVTLTSSAEHGGCCAPSRERSPYRVGGDPVLTDRKAAGI